MTTRRAIAAAMLGAGLAAGLAACALLAQPPHARVQAAAASRAPTFVSHNPCTDAILARVAEPGQILAISHYSHDPRASSMPHGQARRFRATGGTVEEALALDPDIVIADPFMPPATRAALDRLGVRVETVGIPASVAESRAQVRRLAALAGHPAKGERLVAEIDAALRETHRHGAVSALLWQTGNLVPGQGTLAAQVLEHTGFASHSAARGLGQGAYLPLEHVLADPPELVLAAGGERAQQHPALRRLGLPVQQIDPTLLFCGGPTIPRLARRLAEARDAL